MSLLEKPEEKGNPEVQSGGDRNVTEVIGLFLRRPPISVISWLWIAWITDPEPRNRHALKAAWVVRCARPAVNPPTPRPRIMYPSWEHAEEARTFLMPVA